MCVCVCVCVCVFCQMGEFDWDKGIQSSILSSFFYGYIVTQVPGGWLAGRFGGKRVLGIGMTIIAMATVLLPVLARQDYRFVYALRVIMGLASVSKPMAELVVETC